MYSPVDTDPHKWRVKVTVPALCDYRTAAIGFGVSMSSPYPFMMPEGFFFENKVDTVFEASHVSMCHWLQATYLLTASKKGFSAHQLHRTLGVTYKTAWFMFHRLREAMRTGELAAFGADGGIVEVDETFIGHDKTIKPKHSKKGRGYARLSLSQVFLESISEDGQPAAGLEATEGFLGRLSERVEFCGGQAARSRVSSAIS